MDPDPQGKDPQMMDFDRQAFDRWLSTEPEWEWDDDRPEVGEAFADPYDFEGDPAVAIAGVLTAEETGRYLANVCRPGTGLHGAHVADVLAFAYDSDASIGVVEPMAERHAGEWSRLHAYAALALVGIRAPESFEWEDVVELVDRWSRAG